MSEPEEIVARARRMLRAADSALRGKTVLVTAGPTREYIDPVRTISNPSSGKMGFRVAEAAYERGAAVTLVTGPTLLANPPGVATVCVDTTSQMLDAVTARLPETDVLVMAAAPADFSPQSSLEQKVRRTEGVMTLALEPTPDILEATIELRRPGCVTVGFALESEPGLERARAKLERKRLDMIVLNSALQSDGGLGADDNRTTLITRRSVTELPLLSKRDVAEKLLAEVEALL
jgi:phosphopantothenoylcysteine decarboxylase/phosphopantothenate--cysteine ligase